MATFFEQWLDRRMRATTKKDYIEFVDPVVAQICATNWGDGIGITYAQAARVTNLNNVFKGNTSIVSFDELQYFTSLTYLNGANSNTTGEFNGCSNLVSITFPASLTTINGSAFLNCTSLESALGGTLTSIGYASFQGCSSLLDIDLSNVTTIGGNAFNGADLSGYTLNMPYLVSLGGASFRNTNIVAIQSLGSITTTPDHAYGVGPFGYCTSLVSAVIPSTCGYINRYCFTGCTSLTSVTFNSQAFSVADYAFDGCTSLSSANLNYATTIGDYAFRGTALTSATFASVTSIGRAAFISVPLQTISFGASSVSIGREAFYGCASLTTANFPSTCLVTFRERDAFKNCSNLSSLGSIKIAELSEYGLFYGCSSLTTLDLSTSTFTQIYGTNSSSVNGTFQNCTGLTRVVLPATCTTIGQGAFRGCTSLTEVRGAENVTVVSNYAFSACPLTVFDFSSLVDIGSYAMSGSRFTTIKIPNLTATYGTSGTNYSGSFSNNPALETADFGAGMTDIGYRTFQACSSLVTFICRATTPPTLNANVFTGTNANLKIYVPAASVSDYKAASGWSSYASIIEAIPS